MYRRVSTTKPSLKPSFNQLAAGVSTNVLVDDAIQRARRMMYARESSPTVGDDGVDTSGVAIDEPGGTEEAPSSPDQVDPVRGACCDTDDSLSTGGASVDETSAAVGKMCCMHAYLNGHVMSSSFKL